jgi:hypothetical protein
MLLSCLSVARVGKESNVTGTLDSSGKLSLMSGAVAGDSSGKNLRSVGDILMELGGVLVIYALNLIDAESANLLAALAVGSSVVFLICHDVNLLFG